MPVVEPEARPRPRVRRGNEAEVERASAATGTGGGVMKMVGPVEMPLPSHAHALPRCDLGAPQTSNHDPCATRPHAGPRGSIPTPSCGRSRLERRAKRFNTDSQAKKND